MLKFLTWLLSLSSLFALSRPGNGALLPPPGARSTPIVKRDGAQPFRRQDCAAPGLEVDQEQLFTNICNTNPQNDFVTCYNTLLAMMQESANSYCAQQYELYNACLVLNDYNTITCGESRLRFLNCSKATLQAFAICTCYYQQPSPLYSWANVILQTRPKSLTIEIPTVAEIDTSLLLTAPIVPPTAIASLPTGPSSGVTPSSGTDVPIGAGILPRGPLALPALTGLPGLPNLPLPIPIFPALPAGTPKVPTLSVRPRVAIVPTVPVPPVPVLTISAVPTVPAPPTSPAIPVPAVPILPIIPIVPSNPGILPGTIPGFSSIPVATPGLPTISGLPVVPSTPVPPSTILGLPSSTQGQLILPTTIPNGPGTTIGFPTPPTISSTTPCTTFSRFETITATFRQVLLPYYTITYTSAVTSTILSVENAGRETGIGVGVCRGTVTSIIY